jgi:hypothetical protein
MINKESQNPFDDFLSQAVRELRRTSGTMIRTATWHGHRVLVADDPEGRRRRKAVTLIDCGPERESLIW